MIYFFDSPQKALARVGDWLHDTQLLNSCYYTSDTRVARYENAVQLVDLENEPVLRLEVTPPTGKLLLTAHLLNFEKSQDPDMLPRIASVLSKVSAFPHRLTFGEDGSLDFALCMSLEPKDLRRPAQLRRVLWTLGDYFRGEVTDALIEDLEAYITAQLSELELDLDMDTVLPDSLNFTGLDDEDDDRN